MNRDSNFYHAKLAYDGRLAADLWFENGEGWARQLNDLCEYPEICEGYINVTHFSPSRY
jgi:hypothetical protein